MFVYVNYVQLDKEVSQRTNPIMHWSKWPLAVFTNMCSAGLVLEKKQSHWTVSSLHQMAIIAELTLFSLLRSHAASRMTMAMLPAALVMTMSAKANKIFKLGGN